MAQRKIIELNIDSPYTDIIAYHNARFKSLSREDADNIRKQFKAIDSDGNKHLDVHEISKIYEKLGQSKTVTEVRKLIAEVDEDNDGCSRINFVEFINIYLGLGRDQGSQSNLANNGSAGDLSGRIAKSGLSSHAAFFEQSAAATRDTTGDRKAEIKKDFEDRKRVQELQKAEMEKERKEKEEKEQKAQESRAKMAARAALFEKGA